MGTRKLYPIIFRNGQFGTSLSYFISQHKGFHHWTKEVEVYEGVMFKGFKGIAKWGTSELSLDKFFEKFIEDTYSLFESFEKPIYSTDIHHCEECRDHNDEVNGVNRRDLYQNKLELWVGGFLYF